MLLTLAALSGPSVAQLSPVPDRAQLEAQKAQLFQQMLTNPANLEVSFAYAKVSALLGDNEAAANAVALKDLRQSGEQLTLPAADIAAHLAALAT